MIGSDPLATVPAPRSFAAPWGGRGYVSQLGGPVHWAEYAPAADRGQVPLVFVHGLGGSHLNWALVAGTLAAGRRAVALDLHGFGLTPGTRRNATVQANRELLDRFIREVTGTPVILVGNSMGGMISLMQAQAAPDTVAGLALLNPVLPLPRHGLDWAVTTQFLLYALPGAGELFARLTQKGRSPQQVVHDVVHLCFGDPTRTDPALTAASVELVAHRQAGPPQATAFLTAARSLLRPLRRPGRYWSAMASVRVPVLLVGGTADRLVPVTAVRQAAARNPAWQAAFFPGVGHVPQLEVPELTAATIRDWLPRT